jgi:phytoene/squalene synthetase
VVSQQWEIAMTPGLPLEPSKTHRDENFPVASTLIAPKHRSVILAYYRFARGADDVADSPSLSPDAKLAGLNQFEATAHASMRCALRRCKDIQFSRSNLA